MSKNSYSIDQLKELKNKIDNLCENEQIEIYKILKENDCTYTLNKNGLFIKMNLISDEVIKKIENSIIFFNENIKNLKETERYIDNLKV